MKITVQHLMASFLRLTVFLYYDNPCVTAFMGAKLTLFQALISRLLFTRIALLRGNLLQSWTKTHSHFDVLTVETTNRMKKTIIYYTAPRRTNVLCRENSEISNALFSNGYSNQYMFGQN